MAGGIVYCSGPLFCPEEIAGMTAIARALEGGGYDTFLPHRDGLERYLLPLMNAAPRVDAVRARVDRAIFALDVYQLGWRCDALVCNLNGRVPDEGAAVEAGIAFALGRPVVLYSSDTRAAFAGRHNAMLLGLSGRPPVGDVRELPAAVAAASARATRAASRAVDGDLAAALRYGERIWGVLDAWPVRAVTPHLSDAHVAELLAALAAADG